MLDDELTDRPPSRPREDPGEEQVTRQAHPPDDDCGDDDQSDGPERAQAIQRAEERPEPVGQRVEEVEHRLLGRRRVADVTDRGDEQHQRDRHRHPVGGAPPPPAFAGAPEVSAAPARAVDRRCCRACPCGIHVGPVCLGISGATGKKDRFECQPRDRAKYSERVLTVARSRRTSTTWPPVPMTSVR